MLKGLEVGRRIPFFAPHSIAQTRAREAVLAMNKSTNSHAAAPGRPRTDSPRRLAVEAAGRALRLAQLEQTPACTNDERFIGENRRAAVTDELTGICLGCPLLAVCSEFAEVTRPGAGFWAGRWRGHQDLEAKRAEAAAKAEEARERAAAEAARRSSATEPAEVPDFLPEEVNGRAES